MIRFLGNRYTRDDIILLHHCIKVALTELKGNGNSCPPICNACPIYRPCLDLSNLLKRLNEILAIPEGVQK